MNDDDIVRLGMPYVTARKERGLTIMDGQMLEVIQLDEDHFTDATWAGRLREFFFFIGSLTGLSIMKPRRRIFTRAPATHSSYTVTYDGTLDPWEAFAKLDEQGRIPQRMFDHLMQQGCLGINVVQSPKRIRPAIRRTGGFVWPKVICPPRHLVKVDFIPLTELTSRSK